jgi:hypothetical protein
MRTECSVLDMPAVWFIPNARTSGVEAY